MVSWGAPVGKPTQRPLLLPGWLLEEVRTRVARATGHERAAEITARLLAGTATTTIDLGAPGEETWVITGDIPAMWLRDSCLQLAPLLLLVPDCLELAGVAASLLRRHWRMILTDPYANAFNRTPDGNRWDDDLPPQGPWVWERKWELDSLAFPLDLAARLDALGCRSWQTPEFWAALEVILEVAKTEQHHEAKSTYRFTRPDAPASDTLVREGRGPLTRECGLVFQAFRPSDDACQLGFNIPGNAFFASTLGHLAPLLGRNPLKARVLDLASSIEEGIGAHGMIRRPEPHLAYEVNGMGGQLFMDDANLPSLLGLPYLGVMEAGDPLYQATRRRVLSEANPHFVTAPRLRGVGSPHTPPGHVWPIAVAVAGLTAIDPAEKSAALRMLIDSTGGTGWMHESVDASDPAHFTRPWFSWANAMFCELALDIASYPRPALSQRSWMRNPSPGFKSHY